MERRGTAAIASGLALHLAVAGLLFWIVRGGPRSGEAPARAARDTVTRVMPEADLRRESRPAAPADDVGRYLPHPPPLDVWGFRADVAKVRARWDALFPFLTAPVMFDVEAVAERLGASGSLVFIDPRRAPVRPARLRPALTMSPAAVQRVVDRTWTRRERWSRFAEVAALIDRHHPDDGRLPDVVRAYVEQNMLQPYEEMSLADPRRWVMLMLAADDRDFVDFVARRVRAQPRTRTATELLFLVDAVMQGNCNALLLLLDTDPRQDLRWTAHENPQAWVFFDALRDHYADRLRAEGTTTPSAIRRRYDDQRVRLLTTVLRLAPDGYRAGDAHFAIGRIRWDQGDRAAAVREWRQIRGDRRDAFVSRYAPIVEALAAEPAALPGPATVARVEAVFKGEQRRWAAFHNHRLARFGFAAYTF